MSQWKDLGMHWSPDLKLVYDIKRRNPSWPNIDAGEAPALPFEELAGRPGRVRLAEPLVGAVAAVVVGVAPPGLEHALLVVALELVRLAAVGTWTQRDSLQGCIIINYNFTHGSSFRRSRPGSRSCRRTRLTLTRTPRSR